MNMKRITVGAGVGLVALSLGAGLAGCNSNSTTKPAPTVTKTATVTPQTSSGDVLGIFTGTGSKTTGEFSVPSSQDFTVTWQFSDNEDNEFGTSQPDNFIINLVNSDYSAEDFSLPNVIQGSGSGSTEITGDDLSTDSFNVQATGSWTITVKAAN